MMEKIESLPARSGNKTVYFVIVEDQNVRSKIRRFVSSYLDQKVYGIEFVGYEVNSSALVKDYQDAINEANKGKRELFSIIYPWQRVISIRNITYTITK